MNEKPHIYYRNGLWCCGLQYKTYHGTFFINTGYGKNPRESYMSHIFRNAIAKVHHVK